MTATVKKVGKYSVKIVTDAKPNDSTYISETDSEMDIRAVAAVHSAIDKAKVCKKPIAKYDKNTKRAYLEYANGEIKYIN